jgi:surfactin synthase thioesterase subunit
MGPLLEALVAALRPHIERPPPFTAIAWGRSSASSLCGGSGTKETPPLCLFVASRRAPQLKSPCPTIHRLSDDGLVEWLKRAAGTSDILLKNERWLRFYPPALRADLELSEAYHYTAERRCLADLCLLRHARRRADAG